MYMPREKWPTMPATPMAEPATALPRRWFPWGLVLEEVDDGEVRDVVEWAEDGAEVVLERGGMLCCWRDDEVDVRIVESLVKSGPPVLDVEERDEAEVLLRSRADGLGFW
jgi:hypothetical protein